MQPGTVLAVLVAVSTMFADTYGSDSVVTWNQNTQCCRPPWATDSACTLDLTWEEIAEKLTNKTINLKTGGLGTSMINGQVEVSGDMVLCMDTGTSYFGRVRMNPS